MRTSFLLLIISIFVTSCATIVNRGEYLLNITTDVEGSKIQLYDSVHNLPAKIMVRRSKSDLPIILISDSIKRNVFVKSSPNSEFLFGNLVFAQLCPIAYLIDFSNYKRFYYGKSVYIDSNTSDSMIIPAKTPLEYYHRKYPTKTGQINFIFSMPYVNSFLLKPPYETDKVNSGFCGASIGLEYYYKDNNYFAINGSVASDFFAPIGPVDIWGEYDMMSTSYVSFTNNLKYNRFTFGYGINYSTNVWDHRFYDGYDVDPPLREPVKRVSESFGVTLNGYHQFGKCFFMGIIYRPTLLRIKPVMSFKYEHLISIDFAFKFRIKK